MSLLGKILVVIQTILALLFLGIQGTLYYHQNDWRAAQVRTQKRYQKVVERKVEQIAKLEAEKASSNDAKRTAQETVELYKGEIKALEERNESQVNNELKLRSDYDDLKNAHDKVAGSIAKLQEQITRYEDRIGELEDNLGAATRNQELAQAQVARLIHQRAAYEKDLKELRIDYKKMQQDNLDKDLILAELQRQGVPITTLVGNFPPQSPIRAKVAGVDTTVQPSLVLLSVGREDNRDLKPGYTFTVYRGDRFIGKVIVSRLMADSAGCRVLFTAPGETIQQGDDAASALD